MISPGWPETTGNDLKWDFKESVSLGQEKVFDATSKINHKYYSFPQLPDVCSIDTSETTAETRFRASARQSWQWEDPPSRHLDSGKASKT